MSGVDLAQWLGEQLDEDERIARAATAGPWRAHDTHLGQYGYAATILSGEGNDTDLRAWLPSMSNEPWDETRNVWADATFIAEHDPARVLREIDSKRKLLALLPELEQADRLIEGEWGSSDDLADKLREALLAAFPKCGATTVFWPDDEACDAVCAWQRGHGGARHMDETLGGWDEGELTTQHPSE